MPQKLDIDLSAELEHAVMALGVRRYYEMGDIVVKALDGIDLTVPRGEYVAIMGPSGSGKTTLFNCIGGLDQPTDGSVFIDEVDVAELDALELAWLRCRKIGYIFQAFNLVQVMTAIENVTLPMVFGGVGADEALDRGVEILERVGLGERITHTPAELSGGQQQRVAIARAFANDPAIILADEPTANLDSVTSGELMDMMLELNTNLGITFVFSTHDPLVIKRARRLVQILDGRVHEARKQTAQA